MSRVVSQTVYKYDELSDEAKEKAREWYREASAGDTDFADYVIEDAVRLGEMLGISFHTHDVKLMNGSSRQEPNVWWSLGYCQSDFVAFDGSYAYAKDAAKLIRKETGGSEKKLIELANRLTALKRTFKRGTAITASIKHHHYYGLQVEGLAEDKNGYDQFGAEQEKELYEIFRDYCAWLYRRLREELEYQNSDEQVAETITANEYDFDEDGERSRI